MTYHIKVKNGKRSEIHEAEGPRELADTLNNLKSRGLRVSNIRRVVVR